MDLRCSEGGGDDMILIEQTSIAMVFWEAAFIGRGISAKEETK
jgi:hypothetical protein